MKQNKVGNRIVEKFPISPQVPHLFYFYGMQHYAVIRLIVNSLSLYFAPMRYFGTVFSLFFLYRRSHSNFNYIPQIKEKLSNR